MCFRGNLMMVGGCRTNTAVVVDGGTVAGKGFNGFYI